MTWENVYLTCFLSGLFLTAVSFVFGAHLHLPLHLHLPGVHGLHTDGPASSPFNVTTILVFITWFGACGYVVTHYNSSAAGLALVASTGAGVVGAGAMYFYLARVLSAQEQPLTDADFDMVGLLGRISVPIRVGGTGELIYSQEGTRRSCGARAEDGEAIDRGTEVMVMGYEKGIAYVRIWDQKAQSLA